jgi:thioredoxin-related protein
MRKFPILSIILLTAFASLTCGGKKEAQPPAAGEAVAWTTFDQALATAKTDSLFVIVDFYTNWCKWCKVMDQKTYTDPAVSKLVKESFCAAKVNPEQNVSYSYQGRQLDGPGIAQEFNVSGYPTTVFLDSDGNKIGSFSGFVPPQIYIRILTFVADRAYLKTGFDDFMNSL